MYKVLVLTKVDEVETWDVYNNVSEWEAKRLEKLVGCKVNGVEYLEVDYTPSNGMNG